MSTVKKVVGKIPVGRGAYSASNRYYKENTVTLYGMSFRALSDMEAGFAPATINSAGSVVLTNTDKWQLLSGTPEAYKQTLDIQNLNNKISEHSTVRFDRIEENETTINAGEIDSTPTAIVYYKPTNKFVAADNAGNYWDTWDGMEAYMSGGVIRKDKVYIGSNTVYIWSTDKGILIENVQVLQETGDSETAAVSQKCVTEEFNNRNIKFDNISYIDLYGSTANHSTAWRSTNYISVLPNQIIRYRGVGQYGHVFLVAYYDINKNFISGISPNLDLKIEHIDAIIPDNVYYIKACTTIIPPFEGKAYLTILPEENSNIVGDYLTDNRIKLRAYDCKFNNQSFKRDGTNIIINSYNNDIVSTYSSLLLYKDNIHFSNIRANNVVLSTNMALILSKKENEVSRFNSLEEIPWNSPDGNVYLIPVNVTKYNEKAWDIIIGNYNGEINSFMNNNFKIYEAEPENEDFDKGLVFRNRNLFSDENPGYINLSGDFVSTPSVEWFTSDFIEVYEGQRLRGKGFGQSLATPLVAMYDAEKNYIADLSILSTDENGKVEEFDIYIEKGVRYVRILKFGDSESYIIESSRYCSMIKEDEKVEIKLKYSHSLKKPYNFEGKIAKFFGDSVTFGVSTNPWTNPLTNCYRKLFCDMAGLTATNEAISGSFIYDPEYDMNTPKTSSILSQIKNKVVDDNQDFIFVAGGINDFWTGKTLGNIIDEGNISFYGALKEICSHIKSVAPSANVIFLTPINYSKIGGDTPVAELNEYRNAIFEVAVMNGFSVVDTSVIGFPNEKQISQYRTALIEDGVHPTALGHRMMAENLYSILGE